MRSCALAFATLLVIDPHNIKAQPKPRPLHGGIAFGGAALASGAGNDRLRWDLAIDVKPFSRYGAIVGWRDFDADHRGLVVGGLLFEAAAARPRLVLDLHADGGFDLDQRAAVIGAGIRTTLLVIGPLGLDLDSGGYLVIDGIDRSRFELRGAVLVAVHR